MNSNEVGEAVLCRPAVRREDFRKAFQLLYDRYLVAGLASANRTRMRIAAQQLWPECEIFVAEQDQRIVGTVSLVGDGPKLLPLDQVFPIAINSLRKERLRLVEVGCLAALGSNQFLSPVFAALTRATIQHTRKFDRMIAAVHPRHCRFYERAMGFQRLSETVHYESVEGNLAVCVAGNPNAPALYRQPWRDLFFGGQQNRIAPTAGHMSAEDRLYFTNLRKIAGFVDLPVRRAA